MWVRIKDRLCLFPGSPSTSESGEHLLLMNTYIYVCYLKVNTYTNQCISNILFKTLSTFNLI